MKRIVSLLLFVIALAHPILAQDYKAYSFPLGYRVAAMNASGQVAGTGNGQVFLWTRAGGFQYLGNLGGGTSLPTAINDSGAIAGRSTFPDGTIHAFLWTQSGGMQGLGSLLGGESDAFAINAAVQVTGITYAPDYRMFHAFFWSQATGAVDIGSLGGDPFSFAPALNNKGEVGGISTNAHTSETVFRWTQSEGIQAQPSFGAPLSSSSAINDSGQIAGQSTYSDGRNHAALWSPDGSIQDLGILSGDSGSFATLMNAAGHIAGFSAHPSGRTDIARTFFWAPGTGMIDIGAGPSANPGLFGLNNRDQILGQTSPIPGQSSFTYLWSPTLGVHKIGGTLHARVGTFNDAGQFLAQNGQKGKLFTPFMHVTLSSSQNPSVQGQSVTFTANVSAIVGAPPDGEQVRFRDGSRIIGTGTLSNGTASFTTQTLKVGTHNIFAKYAGDSNYYASTSVKLIQVVNP
jgi:probable HAF family extracellular repeat protein